MTNGDVAARFWPEPSYGMILLYLIWIVAASTSPLIYASGTIWSDLFSPDQLSHAVLLSQLLVIILIWPVFLASPTFLEASSGGAMPERSVRGRGEEGGYQRPVRFLVHALTLLVCSLPILALTAVFTGTDTPRLLTGQAMVGALLLGTGEIWWGAGAGNRGWIRPFYAFLVTVSLLPPVCYVVLKQTQDREWAWLLLISPLTVIGDVGSAYILEPRLVHALIYVIGGACAGSVLLFTRKHNVDR